jgi:two-component system, cell cycle response regulator DivK
MKKILIVEDVELNIELLVQLLEDKYELVTAMDGAAALVLLETQRPDLILMDISLPVLDGLETTRLIKARPELWHIPIIALTAHAMQGDADKVRAAGCNGYLTKPLDETLLWHELAQFLET